MPKIVDLIKQQLELLETLQTQLETELHLISSRDADALTTLLADKSSTLDKLAAQDQLIEKTYSNDQADGQSVEADELFEKARKLVEQCKYRTEINAKAVEQGQLRLEHLRNLLLEARARESMTYDKSGKPKGGSSTKGVSA